MTKKIKLQLFLSQSGACSRRKASVLIKEGCVKINEIVIYEPAYPVDALSDRISLNGKRMALKKYEYILLHKPAGVTTTKKDRFAARTVLDLIPRELKHLNPVGRLDKDARGLLLLTNDGQLAYRLTHPRFKVDKTYRLILDKVLRNKDRQVLKRGILLEDGLTAPCELKYLKDRKVEIILYEGRKRQIKRMFAELGYRVTSLERIKEGSLCLGNLPPGKWRCLNKFEIERLVGNEEN